jgi:predicted NAD/FAD-binding protein
MQARTQSSLRGAVRAQRGLAQVDSRATESGRHGTFADAWVRYGFHEDGFTAGLHVVRHVAIHDRGREP